MFTKPNTFFIKNGSRNDIRKWSNRGTNSASYTKLVSLCTPFGGLY